MSIYHFGSAIYPIYRTPSNFIIDKTDPGRMMLGPFSQDIYNCALKYKNEIWYKVNIMHNKNYA